VGRFKFLFFVVIAALLSCFKIPSKVPEWEIRINIPLGDTMVTAQDIVDDTTINTKMTIEIDSFYNDTLWTVFHHSDTARYTGPSRQNPIFSMTIKHKVSSNIDTTKSRFKSLSHKLLTKLYDVGGRCDSAFYGTVVCSITPPDTFHHFDDIIVRFPIYIQQTNNLDLDTTFVVDSFPLGPYKNHITLYHDSGGTIQIDSAEGYAKMPIDFLSRGDTIITFLKGIEVDEELRTNKDKKYLKRVIVHLEIRNRTSAEFMGNFRIGTQDSSIVWSSKPITIPQADADSMGFTYEGVEPTVTVVEDTLTEDYVRMTDEDSLFWQADIIIPPLGKVFLKPEDWIRLYGWVSVDLWINSDSLGGEE